MFQGGIGPVVAYRHTSHQSENISYGIAQPSCKLESEVGIGPTFAVLQTDAYSNIDNSPIKRYGSQVWLPGTYNWTVLFLLYLRLLP